LAVHPDIQRLTGSVIGFFGVIDERIDYQLIEFLADWDPDWHIVMLGPFAKIDPAGLPQRPNLHWLGPQAYEDLPSFTKGMDVCIMPFAINDATEYINPTKALEYMAAGRPVVATALDEVKSNFSGSCDIAESHEEFAAMCRLAILCPPRGSIRRGLMLAAASTWEATVVKMEGHMDDALAESVRGISRVPVKTPHPITQEAYV
jgi:glycosyltransferase involved in cell wall biosynthesis